MAEAAGTVAARPSRALTILKIVGGFSVAFGVIGLWYHLGYLRADYSSRDHPPYFFQAWYIMAGINIGLLIANVLVGVQLVRGRARWVRPLVILEVLVVFDTFVPGTLWLHPRFGSSIAAASGISGGTIFQVITLFPIWGSVAGWWAARQVSPPSLAPVGA